MATVLILGSVTAKRRVAARMAAAALETRGHEVLLLPTMLLSGTYDLGEPAALDTTDYIADALSRWRAQGIAWDCMLLGGVTCLRQAELLSEAADASRARGAWVLLDPILGDGGRMYRSVSGEQAEAMRLLTRHAGLVTPNLTEACLLTGARYEAVRDDAKAQEETLFALARNCAIGALITSAKAPGGGDAVIGWDAENAKRFCIPFARVPGRYLATGDLFSALLADGLLRGRGLEEAAAEASAAVGRAVRGEGEFVLPS